MMLKEVYGRSFDDVNPSAIDAQGNVSFAWKKSVINKNGAEFSEAVIDKSFDFLPAKKAPNALEYREILIKACDALCESGRKPLVKKAHLDVKIPADFSSGYPVVKDVTLDAIAKKSFETLCDDDKERVKNLRGHEYAIFMMKKLNTLSLAKKIGLKT